MPRFNQFVFIASASLISWLWMQGVHELGHVLGASLTGGAVRRVILHPLMISRTDVEPNPHPLFVIWAGPILGVIVPLVIWGITAALGVPAAWLTRFFAGFCLLANGLYIGCGSLNGVGDAGDMLRHGSPIWTLWLFGLATAPAGLALWNGLGSHFGFGKPSTAIDSRLAFGSLATLLITAAVMAAVFR